MWKIKSQGGIKLTNTQLKSEISKAKWLIDIVSNPGLKMNLDIFTTLIGTQKGNIRGRNLIFLSKSYIQNQLKTGSIFYKEALKSVANFELRKGKKEVKDWDREHLFYNRYSRGKMENI